MIIFFLLPEPILYSSLDACSLLNLFLNVKQRSSICVNIFLSEFWLTYSKSFQFKDPRLSKLGEYTVIIYLIMTSPSVIIFQSGTLKPYIILNIYIYIITFMFWVYPPCHIFSFWLRRIFLQFFIFFTGLIFQHYHDYWSLLSLF